MTTKSSTTKSKNIGTIKTITDRVVIDRFREQYPDKYEEIIDSLTKPPVPEKTLEKLKKDFKIVEEGITFNVLHSNGKFSIKTWAYWDGEEVVIEILNIIEKEKASEGEKYWLSIINQIANEYPNPLLDKIFDSVYNKAATSGQVKNYKTKCIKFEETFKELKQKYNVPNLEKNTNK